MAKSMASAHRNRVAEYRNWPKNKPRKNEKNDSHEGVLIKALHGSIYKADARAGPGAQ